MSYLTKQEAIKEVGSKAVEKTENGIMEFTNRTTDGTDDQGFTEFSTQLETQDRHNDEVILIMYTYVSSGEVAKIENLDEIDWDSTIKESARFQII